VVVDSRSLRSAPTAWARGIDGGKLVKGLKFFAACDKHGSLLDLELHPANTDDRAGILPTLPRLAALGFQGDLLGDSSFKGAAFAAAALEHDIHVSVSPGGTREGRFLPNGIRWVVEVVFTQMTKADVLALGAGGQHVADLDLGVGDDHPVDQQQHELAALLEAGPGQPALHPGPESLERGRHAGELLPAGRVLAQLLLLLGQCPHALLQIASPPSVLVERDDRSEVGVREPLQLVPQVRLAAA
jgi:Transposase DDE domain